MSQANGHARALGAGARTQLIEGDCRDVLPTLEAGSVDSVVCDPPYPCIDRPYGRWTEAEWFALMDVVVPECRRVLKPTGSAVFVLQPNSERVGRMRTWLWEFMAKWGREWGVVQDAWWFNPSSPPTIHCNRDRGLMRPSLKVCVWLGAEGCYRNQDVVLLDAAESTKRDKRINRFENITHPSGHHGRKGRWLGAAGERGGVTPFNVQIVSPSDSCGSAGAHGHGAGTPAKLTRWWVRYVTPPGGTVLDPFAGSGTTLLAADAEGRKAVGIERDAGYCEIIRKRTTKPPEDLGLFNEV